MKRFKLLTLILVSILCLTTFAGCKDKNEDVKEYDYSIMINDSYTTQSIFNEESAITTDNCFVVIDLTISNKGLKSLLIWESDFSLKVGEDSYNLIHQADKYFDNAFIKTDKIRFEEEIIYSLVFEIPLEKENETKTLNFNICDIRLSKEINTTRENYFSTTLGEYTISTFEHKYYYKGYNPYVISEKPQLLTATDTYTEIKIPITIKNNNRKKLTINRFNFNLSLNEEDLDIYFKESVHDEKIYEFMLEYTLPINFDPKTYVKYITPQKADSKIATIEKDETYNYEIIFRLKNYEEEINLNYLILTLNDTKAIQINL